MADAPEQAGQAAAPQETAASQTFNAYLDKALQVASQLRESDRQTFLQEVFKQKVLPSQEFKEMFPNAVHARQFLGQYGVPPEEVEKHYPQLQTWEPQGFLGRVLNPQGYSDPRTLNPMAHVGNALNVIGTPGRAVKEAIMTPYYEGLGNPRPYKDPPEKSLLEPGGLRPMIPGTAGEWAESALAGPAFGAALGLARSPGMLSNVLRRVNQNFQENVAGAAAENAAFGGRPIPRPPLALPAHTQEGSRLSQSPYPLGGRVYSPYELQAAKNYEGTRPPQLVPRPKPSDAAPAPIEMQPVRGPKGNVWYGPPNAAP